MFRKKNYCALLQKKRLGEWLVNEAYRGSLVRIHFVILMISFTFNHKQETETTAAYILHLNLAQIDMSDQKLFLMKLMFTNCVTFTIFSALWGTLNLSLCHILGT